MIITSHHMADIQALCQRAVIINQGNLVYDGRLEDINALLGKRKLIHVKTASPVAQETWGSYGQVREVERAGAVLEVAQDRVRETLGSILSGLQVEDFTVTEIPLEESIARFYQKEVTPL